MPVELARHDRLLAEDEDPYWGKFHEVTDAMLEENERAKWEKEVVPPRIVGRQYPHSTELIYQPEEYVDYVAKYIADCRVHGRNPLDPNDDSDAMEGYRAEQWARRMMYESAVGLQTFPLNLCIHQDDLRGMAHRLGPVYLERHFLSALAYEGHGGESQVLGMNGEVLLYNVRYDNQSGDFVSWCLSYMGLLNAVFYHMWHDYVRMWLRTMRVYLVGLSNEIQEDLPMCHLVVPWQRVLQHLFVLQPFTADIPHPGPIDTAVSKHPLNRKETEALKFILDSTYRSEFLETNRVVEEWLHRPSEHSRMFREPYLRGILPDEHWNANNYPEHALVQDVENLLRKSEYLLGFSELFGPRIDPTTVFLRRRMHRLYLNSGLSILLWAPHWQRPFPDGWRHIHTDPNTEVPLRLLMLNPQNNHRYVDYLRFLNKRALFHHPNPEAWFLEQAWGVDIGRITRV